MSLNFNIHIIKNINFCWNNKNIRLILVIDLIIHLNLTFSNLKGSIILMISEKC